MKFSILILAVTSATAVFAATGNLKVDATPGRAGVFVDGKYVGPAKNFGKTRTYAVEAGEHEITVTDPRYEDVVKKITITPGGSVTMHETLKMLPVPKPPFGNLRTINADKFAAVYVNGKFMGHVDEFSNPFQTLQLNPGTYEVKIVPTNGAPITQTVTLVADKTTIVR